MTSPLTNSKAAAAAAAAASRTSARSTARHDRGKFDIKTGMKSTSRGKVFYLYDILGAAQEWKEAIESARRVFRDSKA